MKLETWNLKLLLLFLLCPLPLFGQANVGQVDQVLQALSAEARAAVERPASALLHSTRTIPDGRIDRQTGIRRAVYTPEAVSTGATDPERAARLYLRQYHQQFGLSSDLEELTLDEVVESPGGHHVTFRQIARGIPIYLGSVKVNLDRSLRPVSVFNDIYEHVTRPSRPIDSSPSISRDRARRIVREGISNRGARAKSPELYIYPSDPPRLAWKVTAWPAEGAAEWVMLVDAHDGRFIYGYNAATKLHAAHDSATDTPSTARPSTPSSTAKIQTDGSGLVFDPDPLTTAGVSYGGSYVNNDDADANVLTDELFAVALQELTERNGRFYLEGPHVRIVGSNPRYYPGSNADSVNYSPPSESSPDGFTYTRAHDGFEAVNAYYHVDKSQRYIESLAPAFTNSPSESIRVNPHGEGDNDNSFYYPSLNLISFGQGGVDDGEDASVIWHEYGHVILDRVVPDYLGPGSPYIVRAFHEGWSDYWAASYRRSLVTRSGLAASDFDWRELFSWDAGTFWPGRYLTHSGTYPTSLTNTNIYRDGLLWAATLMEIFTALETPNGLVQARTISDRLNLQSHYYLPSNPFSFTFRDAAIALLQADLQLYEGRHRSLLLDHLEARGFIDPSNYGPALSYNSNTGVSYDNGRLAFEVGASPREFAVGTVEIRYRRLGNSGPFQTTTLTATSNDSLYIGEAVVSDEPGLIEYYIEATDILGIPNTLPSGGAKHPLLAEVGTIQGSGLLSTLQATDGWESTNGGWRIDGTVQDEAYLVLEPMTLASNADLQSYFVLTHRYDMQCSTAGNVKISTNGGDSWEVLHPYSGYPASNLTTPPLQGQSGFCNETTQHEPVRVAFDLSEYTGQTIQLRINFATEGSEEPRGFWDVQEATIYQATLDPEVTTARQLAVHSSYPNPFAQRTTVHFTLPTAGPVTMELYDVLGRRVRLIERRPYAAGTHTVSLERHNLAAGIYFLQLTTPEARVSQPVRVVR